MNNNMSDEIKLETIKNELKLLELVAQGQTLLSVTFGSQKMHIDNEFPEEVKDDAALFFSSDAWKEEYSSAVVALLESINNIKLFIKNVQVLFGVDYDMSYPSSVEEFDAIQNQLKEQIRKSM